MLQITSNMLGFLLLILGVAVGAVIAWFINKRSEAKDEGEQETG